MVNGPKGTLDLRVIFYFVHSNEQIKAIWSKYINLYNYLSES